MNHIGERFELDMCQIYVHVQKAIINEKFLQLKWYFNGNMVWYLQNKYSK
jgi:hypothetical protein